jgi:hypothetical protein
MRTQKCDELNNKFRKLKRIRKRIRGNLLSNHKNRKLNILKIRKDKGRLLYLSLKATLKRKGKKL